MTVGESLENFIEVYKMKERMSNEMKTIKMLTALALSVMTVCVSLTMPLAAQAYKIEECAIPAGIESDFANIGGILAQGDGSLHTFTLLRDDQEPKQLLHHRSADSGKTWQKQDDTGWFNEYAKKYYDPGDANNSPDYFYPDSMVTDGKGTFYFTARTRTVTYEDAAQSAKFRCQSLFRLQNGQASHIKDYDEKPEDPTIMSYSPEGLVMKSRAAYPAGRNDFHVFIADPATGAVKYDHIFNSVQPLEYTAGKFSGWNHFSSVQVDGRQPETVGREVDKRLWITFDTSTGKETRKLVNPLDHMNEENYELFYNVVGSDGDTYFAAQEGLYRLKANGQSFEKLMDGTAAGFAGTRTCMNFYAANNRDFYALTFYWNDKNPDDPKNGTEYKLQRFVPQ